MEIEASDLVIGPLMIVLGVVGLFLASHARDAEMYVFGLSLAGFACLFVAGQIRRHFDRLEAARTEGPHHG